MMLYKIMFFFKFKVVHKAAETTRNINNAFGPETGNECTGQWRFKKFCKGDKSLEDKKHIGQPAIGLCQLLMAGYCTPHLQGARLLCKTS